ncbi:hypothetical protein NDU88_008119 [Pleurodeles waltl]|uniref:Uncharacterized protein n=1 Tax=Pleurodeles waltl TaxID=8319 RepID=A0AAV7VVJ9_PLEWA|nr:hypothetical protein NDU88_008119 [Pleurodeles waltl]
MPNSDNNWPPQLVNHDYDTSLSQGHAALLPLLTSVLSTIEDCTLQRYNSTVDCPHPAASSQTTLSNALFVTAETASQHTNKPKEHNPAMNNVTTIAQAIRELEWSPLQAEQTEIANPSELSPSGKPTILPIIKRRSSLTDQELGALSEQFLSNLEEQIDRTLSLTTTVTAAKTAKHCEKDEVRDGPSVSTIQECPTNAQELAAIRPSQDIMAGALICQSNKMELQLDLFQSLATYLLDVRTKVTNFEKLLVTTRMGAMSVLSDP